MRYRLNHNSFGLSPEGELITTALDHPVAVAPEYARLLGLFIAPTAIADVLTQLRAGGEEITLAELETIVTGFVDKKILIVSAQATESTGSLLDYLNPQHRSEALWKDIGRALQAGKLVNIQAAMRPDFAESVHASVLAAEAEDDAFMLNEYAGRATSRTLAPKFWPTPVADARRMLQHWGTKDFIGTHSGRDCSGETEFGVSLYLPGDSAQVHSDWGLQRNVAYLWQLSHEWKREWGGTFFWAGSGDVLTPAFNSLLLFNVSQVSLHAVGEVTPYARGRRLTAFGWWTGASPEVRSDVRSTGAQLAPGVHAL